MTKAERKKWRSIFSPGEAETFVAAFIASRGGADFAVGVQRRVAVADQYFMSHGLKRMPTLRKLVILLGVPDQYAVSRPLMARIRPPRAAPRMWGGGRGTDIPSRDEIEQSNGGAAIPAFRYVAVTFSAKNVLSAGGSGLAVILEVDEKTSADRYSDRTDRKKLEQALEAAAVASLRKQ